MLGWILGSGDSGIAALFSWLVGPLDCHYGLHSPRGGYSFIMGGQAVVSVFSCSPWLRRAFLCCRRCSYVLSMASASAIWAFLHALFNVCCCCILRTLTIKNERCCVSCILPVICHSMVETYWLLPDSSVFPNPEHYISFKSFFRDNFLPSFSLLHNNLNMYLTSNQQTQKILHHQKHNSLKSLTP